ncbi:DUF881 domain-containing protein [Humibacillus xanthopallidus]|uniref:DUF881 domain-containing protein n=1 Tax=Humibacillus xanthopallidus TaxID=412689 RepID=UPI00384FF377
MTMSSDEPRSEVTPAPDDVPRGDGAPVEPAGSADPVDAAPQPATKRKKGKQKRKALSAPGAPETAPPATPMQATQPTPPTQPTQPTQGADATAPTPVVDAAVPSPAVDAAIPSPAVDPSAPAPATDASAPASSGPELVDDPFVAADAAHGHHVDPVEGRAAWGRLLKMGRPRATRANLLVLLLAVVLGAAIAAQVQLTNERGLTELSQTDLVRVLDDVSLRSSRLDQQVRELEGTRDRLQSGTGTSAEALEQAQKRLDTLGILAGTVEAEGPGITLRISDPDNQVSGPVILDLIQELRDGGAEVIDVGGVRVVASSFVGDSGGQITIDGQSIERPFVIKAIGDSKTLASAMTIPGGIVESVRQKGASATVTESDSVEITSTHEPTDLTHAQPVD